MHPPGALHCLPLPLVLAPLAHTTATATATATAAATARLQLRAAGAAYALVCCTFTNAALLLSYQTYRDSVLLAGKPEATWHGYRPRAALKGWRTYLSLGAPTAAMICLEWW
jgi:hypothetical protein